MEMGLLEKTVISGGYCIGCGACAVPSDSPYEMKFAKGRYYPVAQIAQKSNTRVESVCPFSDAAESESDIAKRFFSQGTPCYDTSVGYSLRSGAMWVNNDKERFLSSSGGVITWVLKYLLQTNTVDGVVHVRPNRSNAGDPRLFKYEISETIEQVESGCSSRYYPISMDQVVRKVSADSRRFVFVGLPCFVKALRLLMKEDPTLSSRILYTIGLVCGHLKTAGFAELLAAQVGITPVELKAINFRAKLPEYPADKYGVEVFGTGFHRDGITVPNFKLLGSNWGHSFFKQKGCDYCDDIFAETADMVVGDAWLAEYKRDWKGTSVVVTRNKDLDGFLTEGIETKQLSFVPLTVAELEKSQRANFSHRRDALPYRLAQVDKQGEWRPKKRFEIAPSKISFNRAAVIDLRGKLASLTQDVWLEVRQIEPSAKALEAFKAKVLPVVDELDFKTLKQNAGPNTISQKIVWNVISKLMVCINFTIRQVRKITTSSALGKKVVSSIMILPPTSPGSLGDEAVLAATLSFLKSKDRKHFLFLSYDKEDDWSLLKSNISTFSISDYLNYRSTKTTIGLLFKSVFVEHLIICGTDVLDGHHNLHRSLGRLAIADAIARVGVPVTIVGSSFSEEAEPATRYALRLLKGKLVMCLRDPISFDVVSQILQNDIKLVADPAFLLPPIRSAKIKSEIIPWIDHHHKSGGFIFGFNANHFLAQGGDGEAVISAFSTVLLKLVELFPKIAICLIPHDVRGNPSDIDLANAIFKRLHPILGGLCKIIPEGLTAGEIKDLVAQMDVIFSGKMHLSIAALGSTVPVGCITYKDKKFLGLFRHFGLEEWLLPETAWRDQDVLTDFLIRLLSERGTIKEKIIAELPRIKRLAEENFTDFLTD